MDLDWLPPFLIPMSDVPPVSIGPAAVPQWMFALTAGPTVLGWLVTYVLSIRQAARDGRTAIPAFLVAVNIAWEFSLAFLLEQIPSQRVINGTWLVVNSVLLYQAFRYGRRDHTWLSPTAFRWGLGGMLVWASLLIMAAANEFHDRDGMYVGMGINVVLSAGFLVMLHSRGSSVGQSMYIGVSKCVGSLFAGATGFLLYPSRVLFVVLVPTMVALDVLYLVRLRRTMLREGRPPWDLRARAPERVPEPEAARRTDTATA